MDLCMLGCPVLYKITTFVISFFQPILLNSDFPNWLSVLIGEKKCSQGIFKFLPLLDSWFQETPCPMLSTSKAPRTPTCLIPLLALMGILTMTTLIIPPTIWPTWWTSARPTIPPPLWNVTHLPASCPSMTLWRRRSATVSKKWR